MLAADLILKCVKFPPWVWCSASAPFQAVSSGRWRGVGGSRLMRQCYSAAAHVGYCAAIIALRARGVLRGHGAQLSVAAISPIFNAVDSGPQQRIRPVW